MVLSMDRWVGKVAIVTGASDGIGARIAEELVKYGLKVVGLARRADKIETHSKKLANEKGKLYAVKTDITSESDIVNAFKWAKENVGPIHILINNAGIRQQTSLVDGDAEKWKKVLDVNVIGLSIATREAIRDMRANNVDGHIVHINSVLGHKIPDIPDFNFYPPSKHTVTALTEVLRLELNRYKLKIKISSVSPGQAATDFGENNGFVVDEATKQRMKSAPQLTVEDCVDAVVYVLSTPPHVQVHELMFQAVGAH